MFLLLKYRWKIYSSTAHFISRKCNQFTQQ